MSSPTPATPAAPAARTVETHVGNQRGQPQELEDEPADQPRTHLQGQGRQADQRHEGDRLELATAQAATQLATGISLCFADDCEDAVPVGARFREHLAWQRVRGSPCKLATAHSCL